MTRDPLLRQADVYRRATIRRGRRALALIAYIEAHPMATRENDPELRRMDDMLGQAHALRVRL